MKFFHSVFFNIILAVIAAVLFVMQEVWLGTGAAMAGAMGIGALGGFGFSFLAEMIKIIFLNKDLSRKFSVKQLLIGGGFGIAAAIVTALIVF